MEQKPFLPFFAGGSFLILVFLGFMLPSGARSLVIQMMIFSIFAMGYDFSFGFTNQCSLGHSIFFGAGAYGAILFILKFKLGLILSLLIGTAIGFLLAFLLGLICVRLTEAYFVIVTAIMASVFHLLAMDMTWLTGGDDGLTVTVPKISFGFTELSLYQPAVNYYFVLFFLILTYFVLNKMLKAPLGKIFISIRENEKRASF